MDEDEAAPLGGWVPSRSATGATRTAGTRRAAALFTPASDQSNPAERAAASGFHVTTHEGFGPVPRVGRRQLIEDLRQAGTATGSTPDASRPLGASRPRSSPPLGVVRRSGLTAPPDVSTMPSVSAPPPVSRTPDASGTSDAVGLPAASRSPGVSPAFVEAVRARQADPSRADRLGGPGRFRGTVPATVPLAGPPRSAPRKGTGRGVTSGLLTRLLDLARPSTWRRPARLGAGPWRTARLVLARYRRPLAIAAALAALWLTIRSAAPPPPDTVTVLVAANDLAAGHSLGEGDLRTVTRPASAAPSGRLTGSTGWVLASPMRAGEPLTDARVVGPGLLRNQPPDRVAVPVRLSDPATSAIVRPGDRVDVLMSTSTDLAGWTGPDLADGTDLSSQPDGTEPGSQPDGTEPSSLADGTVLRSLAERSHRSVRPEPASGLDAAGTRSGAVAAAPGAERIAMSALVLAAPGSTSTGWMGAGLDPEGAASGSASNDAPSGQGDGAAGAVPGGAELSGSGLSGSGLAGPGLSGSGLSGSGLSGSGLGGGILPDGGGGAGSGTPTSPGLLVLAVTAAEAARLAEAQSDSFLSIVLLPQH